MAEVKFSALPVAEGKVQAAGIKNGANVLVDVEDVTDKYFTTYLSSPITVPANAVSTVQLISRIFRNGRYRLTITLYATGVDELSTFRFTNDADPRQYALSDEATTLVYVADLNTGILNMDLEVAAGLSEIVLNTYTGILVERLEEL